MHYGGKKQQIRECKRKQEETTKRRHRGGAAEAHPHAYELRNIAPVAPIQPKDIGEFVDDENFRREPRCQHPLPLGHDRHVRAKDSHNRILAGRQRPI